MGLELSAVSYGIGNGGFPITVLRKVGLSFRVSDAAKIRVQPRASRY